MAGPSITARYADGVTSAMRDVRLSPSSSALLINDFKSPSSEVTRWPFAKIRVIEDGGGSGPAVLACDNSDEARLYIYDPKLLAHIRRRLSAHHQSASLIRIDARNLIVLCVLFVGFMICVPPLLFTGAGIAARAVPRSWEKPLSALVLDQVATDLCHDDAATKALTKITRNLSDKNRLSLTPTVYIERANFPNAMALPGDVIVVNSGLLHLVSREDELAGVLGHEMGHLVYRHPLQGVIESVGLQTAISAISGNSQSLGEAAGVASMLQQMSYGRNMERAADEAAVKYMGGAGYDPAVFGRFLTKMMDAVEKQEKSGPLSSIMPEPAKDKKSGKKKEASKVPEFLEFLSDHPALKERVSLAEKNTAAATGRPVLSSGELGAIRRACMAN